MFYFRTIAFSILLLILGEVVAVSAVTWSFLESATSSFQFIKIGSDNRARDTVVSLAKASEIRMNSKGFEELQKTFSRLVTITENDPDGFRVLDIFLLNPDGVILANSDKDGIATALKDRKPDEKFKSNLYSSALRMRKWQYPEPVILPETMKPSLKSNWVMNQLEILVYKFFTEAKEQKGMVSVAVYHETKLDVIGSVHLIYSRGNIALFLDKQKDIYLWMLRTYVILAFVISVALILLFVIVSIFNRRNSEIKKKLVFGTESNPPLMEKVIVHEKIPNQDKNAAPKISAETNKQLDENKIAAIENNLTPDTHENTNSDRPYNSQNNNLRPSENSETNIDSQEDLRITKRKVVDAIYLGKNGS